MGKCLYSACAGCATAYIMSSSKNCYKREITVFSISGNPRGTMEIHGLVCIGHENAGQLFDISCQMWLSLFLAHRRKSFIIPFFPWVLNKCFMHPYGRRHFTLLQPYTLPLPQRDMCTVLVPTIGCAQPVASLSVMFLQV